MLDIQCPRWRLLVAIGIVLFIGLVLFVVINNTTNTQYDKAEFEERLKYVSGEVTSVSGDQITLNALVINQDYDDSMPGSESVSQMIKQEVVVRIIDETAFNGIANIDDVSVGMTLEITLKDKIRQGKASKALRVVYRDLKSELHSELTNLDMIAGRVMMIKEDGTIVLGVDVVDEKKFKELELSGGYTVPYVTKPYFITVTDSTEFIDDRKVDDIENGSLLNVFGEGNLYERTSFDATKIYIESN